MVKIYPDKVWMIVEEMRMGYEKTRLIAESDDESVTVYLEIPHDTSAYITVFECGENVFYEIITNEADCEETVDRVYRMFLDDDNEVSYPSVEDELEKEADDREAEIEDREFEMHEAAEDLVAIMLKGSTNESAIDPSDFANKIVDAVAKSLHRKGVDIYRPMYLQDEETGDIEYREYPYSELA